MKRNVWSAVIFAFIIITFTGCDSTFFSTSQTIYPKNDGIILPEAPVDGEWSGNYVYLGGMKWRCLTDDRYILLFLDDIPERYKNDLKVPVLDEISPEEDIYDALKWKESYIRRYLNTEFLAKAFSGEEQNLIVYSAVNDNNDCVDKLFLFSFEQLEQNWAEAGFGENGEGLRYSEPWWACPAADEFIRVEADGSYGEYHSASLNETREFLSQTDVAARPLLYIDSNRILFCKDASLPLSDELSTTLSGFDEQQEEPSGEWSLVLSSSAQHVTIEDVSLDGDICSFRYSNATTGEGCGLTAVVQNDSNAHSTLYSYAKIADTSTADSGFVQIQLPEFYNRECKLSVFSERERLTSTGTGYGSKPVMILYGRKPEKETLVSEGLLDPAYIPLPLDYIINRHYDHYLLRWDYEDYLNADDEDRLEAAAAVMMYQSILSGQAAEGELSFHDIDSAEEYAENHLDEVFALSDRFFEAMNDMGTANVKEAMDYANNTTAQTKPGPEDIRDVDIGEYTNYLSFTYDQYLSADSDEQNRIMTAGFIYLAEYRLGITVTGEDAGESMVQSVKDMTPDMELIWSLSPDTTLKELMDQP